MNTPSQIVVVPMSFPHTDVEDLEAKGVIVIRCAEPEKVRLLTPDFQVSANDLFMSALEATMYPDSMSKFTWLLLERLKKREATPSPP